MPENTTTFPTLLQVVEELVSNTDIQAGIDTPPSGEWLAAYTSIKNNRTLAGTWS